MQSYGVPILGLALTHCPIFSVSVEEFDQVMSVNARGVFLCYRYAAAHMIKQGNGGRIIGACSVAGKRGAHFEAFQRTSATCHSRVSSECVSGRRVEILTASLNLLL